MSAPPELPGPWVLVAASSRDAALCWAAAQGLEPAAVLSARELPRSVGALRRHIRALGAHALAVHSTDWSRQNYAQLYEFLLAASPVQERWLIDDETGRARILTGPELARRLSRLPAEVIAAFGRTASEALRFTARARWPAPPTRPPVQRNSAPAVLAIWLGSHESPVGGSVTHASGILGAFRRLGFRVGLVTGARVPEQLAAVVDDVEILPPPPSGCRVSREVAAIAANAPVERAALALAARLPPALVYQRHRAFLVVGPAVAAALRAPLVLEWNASEVWTRTNWRLQLSLERSFLPLLERMERHVLARASLTAAVSRHAAEMALRAGAPAGSVEVVPNGVDLDEVGAAVARTGGRPARSGPLLGWIGSFGPWHGAEVLLRALALLPDEVRLVMIGDGAERPACERLAGELGVGGRVLLTGALPHRLALAELAQCDALISPHVPLPDQPFFGSPTKLFEYMALGKPIVASRLEQLAEVLEDGRTARLVQPGDPAEFAAAVAELLHSPERGRALGEAARCEAEEHHTWERRARLILSRVWPETWGTESAAEAEGEAPRTGLRAVELATRGQATR